MFNVLYRPNIYHFSGSPAAAGSAPTAGSAAEGVKIDLVFSTIISDPKWMAFSKTRRQFDDEKSRKSPIKFYWQ